LVVRPEGRCGDASDPCPLIFFLHSNTDNPRANLPHWQGAAADGWLLALPQSSRAMWAGAYVWGEHEAAAKELQDRYAQLTEQYPVDSGRVALAGFSMGAEIALYMALSGRIKSGGFILLGPGGPFMDDLKLWQPLIEQAAGSGLSGTIIMGLADETIPQANVRELAAMLNDHDIPTELEEHPELAHEYPPDFEVSLSNALDFIFG
jgi:predicted esterase